MSDTRLPQGLTNASTIVHRPFRQTDVDYLQSLGLPALFARLYASRGVLNAAHLETRLQGLHSFSLLKNALQAGQWLADKITQKQKIIIVADYDADGATACALAMRGLQAMGAVVDFVVPNRFMHGYGLTPEVVDLCLAKNADAIMTVDNGIASVQGVAYAKDKGLSVLVTDHHLAGDVLPDALIVNPNQPDCTFPSKHLAGVGVVFYVLMALRAVLREQGVYPADGGPNLAQWLDIVALGTVADVVVLDTNNRILVQQGLLRIRSGQACAGIQALFEIAGVDIQFASSQDLSFGLGPRLNAAGRLDDMSLGIHCLLAQNSAPARTMAQALDSMNQARKQVEQDMQASALLHLAQIKVQEGLGVCLYDADWHQGVIGILASRIKEKMHRPTIVFAQGQGDELKGSGRSIEGVHLRDILDCVSKRHPNLLLKFGGHAAAAGLSIKAVDLPLFTQAFNEALRDYAPPESFTKVLWVDGELAPEYMTIETALQLQKGVWGQGFAHPQFMGDFEVAQQKLIGKQLNHLKLRLRYANRTLDAVFFNQASLLPERVRLVYQLNCQVFMGQMRLQLLVQYADRDLCTTGRA